MDSKSTPNEYRPVKGAARGTGPSKTRKCLACGEAVSYPSRRYCSKTCRQQMNWVLSLSKGLLKAFNARYAAFSFTDQQVILDVLPVWSKGISRFASKRTPGKKPAEDMKALILESGKEWHHLVGNNTSRTYASLSILNKNQEKKIDPQKIKPSTRSRPRLSKHEKDCLKTLQLNGKDLSSECAMAYIKSAYKKMAKIHHPDMGGDEERFKRLNEAHTQMLLWTQNPQYTSRKALRDCWSYDGTTNRWSPPL